MLERLAHPIQRVGGTAGGAESTIGGDAPCPALHSQGPGGAAIENAEAMLGVVVDLVGRHAPGFFRHSHRHAGTAWVLKRGKLACVRVDQKCPSVDDDFIKSVKHLHGRGFGESKF